MSLYYYCTAVVTKRMKIHMTAPLKLTLILFSLGTTEAFLADNVNRKYNQLNFISLRGKGIHPSQEYYDSKKIVHLYSKKDESEHEINDAADKEEGKRMLPLPPIGGSSFDPANLGIDYKYEEQNQKPVALDNDEITTVGMVGSSKFELQYTCNICDTRNVHKVSRLGTL